MHLTRMRYGGVPPFTEPVEFRFDEQVNLLVGTSATGKSRMLSANNERFNKSVMSQFAEYSLPIISLDKETPKEAVYTVFEKVNTGGVTLSMFELVTASFAAQDENLSLREDWDIRRNRLHGAFGASQFEEEAVEGKSNQGGVGVDHTSEYPADEGAQSDYAARRFGWRSQSRRRQRGRKRVPPDTRGLHAPVFVPLADLSSARSSEGPDKTGPRPDEENRPFRRKEGPFGVVHTIGTSSGNAGDQG